MSNMFYGGNNGNGNQYFARHLCNYIGEMVIIFTESGGASGSGFSGVLFSVNNDFVRLITRQGTPPECPISDICDGHHMTCSTEYPKFPPNNNHNDVGSICDIPICQIVSFCHNAV